METPRRPARPAPDPVPSPAPDAADYDILVPASTASWSEIQWFALTYAGYTRNGGFGPLATMANATIDRWFETRELPDDPHVLRSCLFFEQRRWRHLGQGPWLKDTTPITEPVEEDRAYVEAVLDRIRELCGGQVPPPDPFDC